MQVNGCLNFRSYLLHEQFLMTYPPLSGATPYIAEWDDELFSILRRLVKHTL
jgi:hypothetical protein